MELLQLRHHLKICLIVFFISWQKNVEQAVNTQSNMSPVCAVVVNKANWIWGCFRRSLECRLTWVVAHLSSLLLRLLPSLESTSWNGMLKRWRESREGSARGWEHMAYKMRLRELWLLSLMERRQRSDPTAACDYCQGPSEHVRAKCFHPDGKIKCCEHV